jgi:alpha-glucosidase (family GH31 glycosyl hydrolase)
MEVAEPEGIHFGYLLPWAQINSWNYFRMPWVQGDSLAAMHREYARLRSRLVPYLYSWAYEATRNGYPLMAPLALEFGLDRETRRALHQYLLGRDLMVVIYRKEAYFPPGSWKDYWTGEVVQGGMVREIHWPPSRGGGLYVREGAIIPLGPVLQYRGERALDEIELYVFPGAKESSFLLYRDDGVSLEHRDGHFATTGISVSGPPERLCVSIARPDGSYAGEPATIRWSLRVALPRRPFRVSRNGPLDPGEWSFDDGRGELSVSAGADVPVTVEIELTAAASTR